MEVLNHGNTYKKAECKKCGALLSYCFSDLKLWGEHSDYFGKIHHVARQFIKCPECKSQVTLKYFVDGIEVGYKEICDGLKLNEEV